jgi:hypothetical protein
MAKISLQLHLNLKVTGEQVKGRMVREATWLCGAMPRSDSCWCVSGGGEKLISSHGWRSWDTTSLKALTSSLLDIILIYCFNKFL